MFRPGADIVGHSTRSIRNEDRDWYRGMHEKAERFKRNAVANRFADPIPSRLGEWVRHDPEATKENVEAFGGVAETVHTDARVVPTFLSIAACSPSRMERIARELWKKRYVSAETLTERLEHALISAFEADLELRHYDARDAPQKVRELLERVQRMLLEEEGEERRWDRRRQNWAEDPGSAYRRAMDMQEQLERPPPETSLES
jgi:hypothetical protein